MTASWAQIASWLACAAALEALALAVAMTVITMLWRELRVAEPARQTPAAVTRGDRLIADARASLLHRVLMRVALAVSGALLAALLWGWARATGAA